MGLFKKIREGFEERARQMHKGGMALAKVDELLNELCERLRQIGVNGTVHVTGSVEESMGVALTNYVLGHVKIEGRNIDLVQVERRSVGGPSLGDSGIDYVVFMVFYYHYVVRANVEGLEDRLKAEVKPIKKGLLSREVVDFKWEGGELAQLLNTDFGLKNMMLKDGPTQLPNIEVKPHKKPLQVPGIGKPPQAFLEAQASFNQCVRITKRPKIPSNSEAHKMFEVPQIPVWERKVGVELPTRETFEIYNRIAQHIHSIATARP